MGSIKLVFKDVIVDWDMKLLQIKLPIETFIFVFRNSMRKLKIKPLIGVNDLRRFNMERNVEATVKVYLN